MGYLPEPCVPKKIRGLYNNGPQLLTSRLPDLGPKFYVYTGDTEQ